MQQPPPSASKLSPNAITTEQIQKCLEDNKNLIMAIMENQNLGKFQECAQYQAVLQKNLMYLAAIADAHPPAPATPQIPNQSPASSSLPPGFMPQQANNFMQQQPPQPVIPQQPGGGGGGGGGQKLQFQLNSLRTQEQQQQLLHFQQQQQQQQQQMQAQMGMGMRPGGQNSLFGMHPAMVGSHGGDMINGQGSKQDGSSEGGPVSNRDS